MDQRGHERTGASREHLTLVTFLRNNKAAGSFFALPAALFSSLPTLDYTRRR
jgi:hypothetical protein